MGVVGSVSESMRGPLSKCDWRGTEMVDSDEINDEITSGEPWSTTGLTDGFRDGFPLRRRDRRAEDAWKGASSLDADALSA